MRGGFLLFLLCFGASMLGAQNYYKKGYKIEHGLPTNLVKAVTEDNSGNLWIATDEGFVRYNAARFETYAQATHSNYTKGFFHTRSGRLLAFGDLDVLEVKDKIDSIEFHSVVPVSWSANDSSLTYPKLIYEDCRGTLWFSESQSVVKLEENKLRRYNFSLADRTPQFLRSFSFFEDANRDLFAVSVAGNVFRFDRENGLFVDTSYRFPAQVEFVGVLNDQLVIGALTGLYVAAPTQDGKFGQPQLKSPIASVSYVAALPDRSYFVATHGVDHFKVDSTFSEERLILTGVADVNHVYVSREHDIWLSTGQGVVLMQEAALQGPVGKETGFIESIAEDVYSNDFYYATRQELHSFDRQTQEDKLILRTDNGYFRSLVSTKKGVWAANAFQVMLLDGGKTIKTFDFSNHRTFVTSINKDFRENVWLAVPGLAQVFMIDENLQLHSFNVPIGKDGFINDVKDGGDGVYVVSHGLDYLFYKSYHDTVFHSISVPVKLNRGEELNTFGLVVQGKSIWLATSLGLMKYDRKKIQRVDLGERYNGVPIRSIYPNGNAGLLLVTPRELLYYDINNADCAVFASARHLSNVTVNSRSLMISRDKTVWIGTAQGILTGSRPLTYKQKTVTPRIAYLNIGGRKTTQSTVAAFPYNAFLSMIVTSITFPEEERVFEFRHANDQRWTRLTGSSIDIITSDPGEQHIQIRARKTGIFEWSDVTHVHFTVLRPFWRSTWFYLLLVVALFAMIALTALSVKRQEMKQKIKLEAIVAERTAQLDAANRELEAFSYSVSHDLRGPLRSIIGFSHILDEEYGAKIDEEGRKTIAKLIRNAKKMNQLIDDLLRLSRLIHHGLAKGPVKLDDQVRQIVAVLRESEYGKTHVNIQPLPTVNADRRLIEQVWYNLISNGMKYSSRKEHPQVDISYQEQEKEFVFCVKDNGAGFDMKHAGSLFGVFQRLHGEHEFPGIGIGLAIVHRIVTRHHGRVWAEGEVNVGAAFYFSLPK